MLSNKDLYTKVTKEWTTIIHKTNKYEDINRITKSKNYDCYVLKNEIIKLISHNNKYYKPKRYFKFPGPMVSNFSIRYIKHINTHEYYITEKSDGLRVMLYSIYMPKFPKWYFRNNKNIYYLSPYMSSIIESYALYCVRNKKASVYITEIDSTFKIIGNNVILIHKHKKRKLFAIN